MVIIKLAESALTRVLFGVTTSDAAALVTAGSFLLLAALIAGVPPALRAMRVDPVEGLRAEWEGASGAYGAWGANGQGAHCIAWVYPVAVADEPHSKTQLDKLGDRLRAGSRKETDLRALDEYRRSFRPAFDTVLTMVTSSLSLECTARPAKTTTAIVDKLNRQRIRLTQMQDIAGLRVIVTGVIEQDRLVSELTRLFPDSSVNDRRVRPSHGYRAVHVIAAVEARFVEIQVLTEEQQMWAVLSEKLADVVDPAIKYGGGAPGIRTYLLAISGLIADLERTDAENFRLLRDLHTRTKGGTVVPKGIDSHQVEAMRAATIDRLVEIAGMKAAIVLDLMELSNQIESR